MHFKSNKTQLFLLAITALIGSRIVFLIINDSEGPNLLITTGMAVIVYVLSLLPYCLKTTPPKKYMWAIGIQALVVIGLGICLR